MGNNEFQISARFVADIFAKMYPAIYDGPRYGGGDPYQQILQEFGGRAASEQQNRAAINPQPLPPRWAYAVTLADAYLSEFVALDRTGRLLGGEVSQRALETSLSMIADIDELCPRWPKLPWPWPPPPKWLTEDEMNQVELFAFGTRLIAGAGVIHSERLSQALGALGEKVTSLSTQSTPLSLQSQ
jgi:hypothetical protein